MTKVAYTGAVLVSGTPYSTLVPPAYYQSLWAATEGIKISWQAYSVNPNDQVGGGTSIKGNYSKPQPESLYRDTMVMNDLLTGAADYVPVNYLPPTFMASGRWPRSGEDIFLNSGAVQKALVNLDSIDMDPQTGVLNLSMLTQDGSSVVFRVPGSLIGAPAATIGQLFQQVFNTTDPTQINPSVVDAKFAVRYTIQQGAMNDILRKIAGIGVYFNVKLLGSTTNPVLVKTWSTPQVVRLIGLDNPIRTLERPTYVPSVTVNNYNTKLKSNYFIWKAAEVYTVDSNASTEVRVTMNGTPLSDGSLAPTQPVALVTIPSPLTYNGDSAYVVYDSAGYEAHVRFQAGGGSLKARVGDVPNELVLTFTGPNEQATQTYSFSDGINHPAIYVSFKSAAATTVVPITVPSGVRPPLTTFRPPDQPLLIDNDLVGNTAMALDRAAVVIAHSCLPCLSIRSLEFDRAELYVDGISDLPVPPDEICGSVFRYSGSMWRIMTLDYDSATDHYTGTAEAHTLCGDVANEVGSMTLGAYLTQITNSFNGVFPTMQQISDEPLLLTS